MELFAHRRLEVGDWVKQSISNPVSLSVFGEIIEPVSIFDDSMVKIVARGRFLKDGTISWATTQCPLVLLRHSLVKLSDNEVAMLLLSSRTRSHIL